MTPTIAKHRLFSWLRADIVPDHALIVFARDDDYTFGVLHSHAHELWSLGLCTSLEDRPRYTPSSTFETFPFPHSTLDSWGPVAQAAALLHEQRSGYLAKAGAGTMTELYNRRPAWLAALHADLDAAVHAAYGWEYPLADDEILKRLLELNLERPAVGGCVQSTRAVIAD